MYESPISPMGSRAGRFCAACLAGTLSGFVLVVLSGVIHTGADFSLFVSVDSAVKNISSWFLVMLFVIGCVWGLALKWPYSFAAAIFQLASLPIVAVIEMVKDPTSHNLWPLEFMIYAGLSLFSVLGMSIGLGLKRALKPRVTQR